MTRNVGAGLSHNAAAGVAASAAAPAAGAGSALCHLKAQRVDLMVVIHNVEALFRGRSPGWGMSSTRDGGCN